MSTASRSATGQKLAEYESNPVNVLQIMRQIQYQAGCVDADAIEMLSDELGIPRARISALVQFYSFLHEEPRGEYDLYLSDNITDRMLGSLETAEVLTRELGLSPEGRSEDGRVSLSKTSCTGLCERGPAMIANGHAIQRVDKKRAKEICQMIFVEPRATMMAVDPSEKKFHLS